MGGARMGGAQMGWGDGKLEGKEASGRYMET